MDTRVGYHVYLRPGTPTRPPPAAVPGRLLAARAEPVRVDRLVPAGVLDDAVRGGTVPPVIMVFASGGGRSFYCDAPGRNILPGDDDHHGS
jgi:hypothetical protein